MKTLRSLVLSTLVIAMIAAFAAPAFAHAAYKSSDPPDNGQVAGPPGEVTATFTEPLANGSFLEITDPCGERVDGGDVRIVGYDMSVSMSGAAAGRYTVFYRAFSTLDPHVTEGTFGFTATAGESCAGEEPSEEPDDPGDDTSTATESQDGSSNPASTAESGEDDSSGSVGADGGTRRRPAKATVAKKEDRPGASARVANATGAAPLAAEADEEGAPSVWDGIRLEPFLTGLMLAAIIGAAGGKVYAGIMGPRA